MKKFLFIFTFISILPLSVQSAVLTIDKEPPELIQLKQDYAKQKQAAATPSQFKKLQEEYEEDTEKALNSPIYIRQKNALDAAEARETQAIEEKYQARQEKLKSNAVVMVDRKYKVLLENHKQKSQKETQSQYIVNLKRLEDKFIRQGDLANALVVQTERKAAMQSSESTIASITQKKATPKPPQVVTPEPVAPPTTIAVKKIAPPPVVKITKRSSSVPKTYSSTQQGFAGSGENNKDNVYSFDISPTQKGAALFFHAFGRKSNDSYGEVYLSTPDGEQHQVASWSPDQLKKSSYLDVSAAEHVDPITADISKYVTQPGTYKVKFVYRDGNQALIIYKAGIKTL